MSQGQQPEQSSKKDVEICYVIYITKSQRMDLPGKFDPDQVFHQTYKQTRDFAEDVFGSEWDVEVECGGIHARPYPGPF